MMRVEHRTWSGRLEMLGTWLLAFREVRVAILPAPTNTGSDQDFEAFRACLSDLPGFAMAEGEGEAPPARLRRGAPAVAQRFIVFLSKTK